MYDMILYHLTLAVLYLYFFSPLSCLFHSSIQLLWQHSWALLNLLHIYCLSRNHPWGCAESQFLYPRLLLVVRSLEFLEWVECFEFVGLEVYVGKRWCLNSLLRNERRGKKSQYYLFFLYILIVEPYNPMFWCRSFLELQAAFESFKCIPQRYSRPTSLSNWLTVERVQAFIKWNLDKIALVALKGMMHLSFGWMIYQLEK